MSAATIPDETLPGFYAAVLAGLPEAVVVADGDGAITFVNDAARALLGYGLEALRGEPITTLVPRQEGRRADPVAWLARWAAAPDVEQYRFLEMTARRRDGQELAVEVRVRLAHVGQRPRYVISLRDNTARRREQLALRDANLRAARILLVAEDAIVTVGEDQKIRFFNLAAERMFGYGQDEVDGKPLDILLPPGARAGHRAMLTAFAATTQPSRMMGERAQVSGLRRSGEVFPIEATITKVSSGGELTFTAALRDVTERNRTQSRIEEAERRIRAVFDHASEAMALLTPAGEVLEINHAAEALTEGGRPLVGSPLWEAPWLGADLAVDPSAAQPLRAAIETAAAGEPAAMQATLQRDGRPLAVSVRLTPITSGGEVRYVLAEGRFEA